MFFDSSSSIETCQKLPKMPPLMRQPFLFFFKYDDVCVRLCAASTKILSIMVDDLDYHLDENLELIESEEVQSDLQALDCCLAMIFFNMLILVKKRRIGEGPTFF